MCDKVIDISFCIPRFSLLYFCYSTQWVSLESVGARFLQLPVYFLCVIASQVSLGLQHQQYYNYYCDQDTVYMLYIVHFTLQIAMDCSSRGALWIGKGISIITFLFYKLLKSLLVCVCFKMKILQKHLFGGAEPRDPNN